MKKEKTKQSLMLDVLKQIKPLMKKKGTANETHCGLGYQGVIACNNGVSVGIKTNLFSSIPVLCWVDYNTLAEAIKAAKDSCELNFVDNNLVISSGNGAIRLKAERDLTIDWPDTAQGKIYSEVNSCFELLKPLLSSQKEKALECIRFQTSTAIATHDKKVVIEYYHGTQLPPMLVSKLPSTVIAGFKEPLEGLAYTGDTATFWFMSGSFVKTKLVESDYPNIEKLFDGIADNAELNPYEKFKSIPKNFFNAISRVSKFDENGRVKISKNAVSSNSALEEIEIEIESEMIFDSKLLMFFKEFDNVFFDVEKNVAYFIGYNKRGLVAGVENADE